MRFSVKSSKAGVFEAKLAQKIANKKWQRKILGQIGRQSKRILREQTDAKGLVAFGDFKAGWRYRTLGPNRIRIFNVDPGALAIETGRAPGAALPPIGEIERWAQLKFGTSGLGYHIARGIAARGTAARPVLSDPGTQEKILNAGREVFETAISSATRRSIP